MFQLSFFRETITNLTREVVQRRYKVLIGAVPKLVCSYYGWYHEEKGSLHTVGDAFVLDARARAEPKEVTSPGVRGGGGGALKDLKGNLGRGAPPKPSNPNPF